MLKNLKDQGTTLIETLVSLVIIVIIALGGMALHFNTFEIKAMSHHKKIAMELANSRMEEYRTETCAGLLDGAVAPYSSTVGGFSVAIDELVTKAECRVNVNVAWNEAGQIGRDFWFNLVTYVR